MFRFTTRRLLWLTLIVALAVGGALYRYATMTPADGRSTPAAAATRRDAGPPSRKSDLALSLGSNHRDYICCGVVYLQRNGAPDSPQKKPESLADFQALGKRGLHWLKTRSRDERHALERGFGEFRYAWSPIYRN